MRKHTLCSLGAMLGPGSSSLTPSTFPRSMGPDRNWQPSTKVVLPKLKPACLFASSYKKGYIWEPAPKEPG